MYLKKGKRPMISFTSERYFYEYNACRFKELLLWQPMTMISHRRIARKWARPRKSSGPGQKAFLATLGACGVVAKAKQSETTDLHGEIEMTRLGLIVGVVFVLLGAVIVAFAAFASSLGREPIVQPSTSPHTGAWQMVPSDRLRCCACDATSSSSLSRCTFRRGAGGRGSREKPRG